MTVDHEDGGSLRLDSQFAWDSTEDPVSLTPEEEIVCDVSAGYVCARDACSVLWHEGFTWHTVSPDVLLAEQDGMLIEYDIHTFSPIGVLLMHMLLMHVSVLPMCDLTAQGGASSVGRSLRLQCPSSSSLTRCKKAENVTWLC
jgi:hypothetical protein